MPAERFTSPIGRLVQGDCFTPQTKDQQGNPRVIKTGPNAGQPNPQFYIGVAFAKNDPQWPAFWAMIDRVARSEWPALFPNPQAGSTNPKFAYKVLDGDGYDTNGKANNLKEGWAGHYVVRFTSSFAPKLFRAGHYQPQDQITDPQALKRGYYVRVNGSIKGNDNPQNPGLFLNFDLVEIAGFGPEIVSGPDAGEAFGGAPVGYVPPGMSATPILPGGPAGAPPAGPPGYTPPPAAPPPAAGPPGYTPPPAGPVPPPMTPPPISSPTPSAVPPPGYTGYMQPPPPAPAAPPPSAPPPAAGPQMTAAAGATTYEAFRAAGWTDEQLRANGYML